MGPSLLLCRALPVHSTRMPTSTRPAASIRCTRAPRRCRIACIAAIALAFIDGNAVAATLAEKARESECVGKPESRGGELYRCQTKSGYTAFFNLSGSATAPAMDRAASKAAIATPTPPGFPRVDVETQKGRDDVRRKVLNDELGAEEKLLVEARSVYSDGAPVPLPEERANAEKYRERISRLRQAVNIHEKNVEALKKELQSVR